MLKKFLYKIFDNYGRGQESQRRSDINATSSKEVTSVESQTGVNWFISASPKELIMTLLIKNSATNFAMGSPTLRLPRTLATAAATYVVYQHAAILKYFFQHFSRYVTNTSYNVVFRAWILSESMLHTRDFMYTHIHT